MLKKLGFDIILQGGRVEMAGSTFGTLFRISTWGESHGRGVGVVVDGCPAGLSLCEEDIQKFLDRRKPGSSQFTTQRKESDSVEILSGIFEGKTTGTPISLVVKNTSHFFNTLHLYYNLTFKICHHFFFLFLGAFRIDIHRC